MECRKCKAIIPDDGMFCPICGSRADGNKPCKLCGKLIPEEAVFCVYCGQRIDGKATCPKCSAILPENAVFCSHCRTRLDNKVVCSSCGQLFEGEFCPFCGEAYVSEAQTQVASTVVSQPVPSVVVPIPVNVQPVEVQPENKQEEQLKEEVLPQQIEEVEPVLVDEQPVEIQPEIQQEEPKEQIEDQPTTEPNKVDVQYVEAQPVQQVKEQPKEQIIQQPVILPAPVVAPVVEQNAETVKTTTMQKVVGNVNEQKKRAEVLQCPQCFGTDLDIVSDDLAICKHCMAQIKLNFAKEPKNITNIVNVQMSGNGTQTPITYHAMPCEIDSKQFLVEALTKVALNKEAPEDIFETGEFSAVRKEDRQYLVASGLADMTYSATVGYDYTVKYTKYDSNGKPYTATRTETRWEPFSGTHKGEYTNGVANGDDAQTAAPMLYLSEGSIGKAVEYEKADFETEAPLAPQEYSIEDAKQSIERSASYDCERNLPGHRHKQFICNGTVELKKIECHVVPQYILDYKYKEEQETLYRHASTVGVTRGRIVSAKAETLNEVEENVKKLNFITFGALLLSILVSLLIPVPFLIVIFGVAALASFIYLEVVRAKTKKTIYKRKSEARRKGLIRYLSERGIELPDGIDLEQAN